MAEDQSQPEKKIRSAQLDAIDAVTGRSEENIDEEQMEKGFRESVGIKKGQSIPTVGPRSVDGDIGAPIEIDGEIETKEKEDDQMDNPETEKELPSNPKGVSFAKEATVIMRGDPSTSKIVDQVGGSSTGGKVTQPQPVCENVPKGKASGMSGQAPRGAGAGYTKTGNGDGQAWSQRNAEPEVSKGVSEGSGTDQLAKIAEMEMEKDKTLEQMNLSPRKPPDIPKDKPPDKAKKKAVSVADKPMRVTRSKLIAAPRGCSVGDDCFEGVRRWLGGQNYSLRSSAELAVLSVFVQMLELVYKGLRDIEILSPVGEMEQSAPMVSKFSGEELIESGSSGRSKGRRRRKKRGFRVGDEERLDGLEKWIEDLKEKVGHDEELIRAVDEAYEEVLELFEEALEELGVPGEDMDDELVCKAALIFWKKWEKIIQTSKELREAHAVSKGNERGESSGEQWESVGGEKKGEGACGSDKIRGKEEDAIYEECDIVGEEIGVGFREKEGEKKKYHVDCDECSASSEEEANVEYGDDEYDDVENDANVEDGEYDEYEFNDDEWLDWLEGKLRYARGVNWMNEVLKEIYSYMQVVYDEQQQVHWEEEGSMALKACIILREVVRVSPMRGCLHPESELGYLLLMNQEIIGRRLCRWAWRRFRRGWEEKLMRLDVNPYCS
nr:hypothetical protein Iba_chr14fCG0010 [Ipomoea batatas]